VIRYLDLLAPAAAELRPGELSVAALVRRAGVGAFDPALTSLAFAAVAVVVAAVFLLRTRQEHRMVLAPTTTLLSVPHVLLHDAVLAYPTVAARATNTRATLAWAVTGLLAVLVHEGGIPIAPLWLLALALWPDGALRRLRASRPDPTAA
jgi:hypothetical protein